jgi:hypothetical protein
MHQKKNCVEQLNKSQKCIDGLIGPLCEQCDVKGEVWE